MPTQVQQARKVFPRPSGIRGSSGSRASRSLRYALRRCRYSSSLQSIQPVDTGSGSCRLYGVQQGGGQRVGGGPGPVAALLGQERGTLFVDPEVPGEDEFGGGRLGRLAPQQGHVVRLQLDGGDEPERPAADPRAAPPQQGDGPVDGGGHGGHQYGEGELAHA